MLVQIWNLTIRDGAFVIEHVKRLHHMDQAGFDIGASITAILPMEQTVYTGDDDGRVVRASRPILFRPILLTRH